MKNVLLALCVMWSLPSFADSLASPEDETWFRNGYLGGGGAFVRGIFRQIECAGCEQIDPRETAFSIDIIALCSPPLSCENEGDTGIVLRDELGVGFPNLNDKEVIIPIGVFLCDDDAECESEYPALAQLVSSSPHLLMTFDDEFCDPNFGPDGRLLTTPRPHEKEELLCYSSERVAEEIKAYRCEFENLDDCPSEGCTSTRFSPSLFLFTLLIAFAKTRRKKQS